MVVMPQSPPPKPPQQQLFVPPANLDAIRYWRAVGSFLAAYSLLVAGRAAYARWRAPSPAGAAAIREFARAKEEEVAKKRLVWKPRKRTKTNHATLDRMRVAYDEFIESLGHTAKYLPFHDYETRKELRDKRRIIERQEDGDERLTDRLDERIRMSQARLLALEHKLVADHWKWKACGIFALTAAIYPAQERK